MITLITGLPGAGKTLYTLATVKALAEKHNRPVFYSRIPGLKLPWTQIDPFEWYKCPPNSIIVIDEVQRSNDPGDPKAPTLFGLRKRGEPVPKWAAELETHRHLGIDLFIITQNAGLIDSHDRKLVNHHFHVKRTFGLARATVHEFTGARDDAQNRTSGSVRHEWAYPKAAFEWYQSAEVHTGKARVPFKVWLFLALPVVIIGLTWYAWVSFLDPDRKKGDDYVLPATAASAPPQSRSAAGSLSTAQYLAQFEPRVPGLHYTAPVYDEVTRPTVAPYPAACVLMGEVCRCYSQQGTKLSTSADLCRSVVDGGFFVAWSQPEKERIELAQREAIEPPSRPAISLGGETGGWRKLDPGASSQ
jgi:hypothetical protein